jgi:hypothetical protein
MFVAALKHLISLPYITTIPHNLHFLYLGVVKFDINYTVTGPDVSSFQSFSDVPDILQESEVIDVMWQDGQKMDITVRATDIIGEYTDDTITIYKDTTNPEISCQNRSSEI